jgi:hypothetical protein
MAILSGRPTGSGVGWLISGGLADVAFDRIVAALHVIESRVGFLAIGAVLTRMAGVVGVSS